MFLLTLYSCIQLLMNSGGEIRANVHVQMPLKTNLCITAGETVQQRPRERRSTIKPPDPKHVTHKSLDVINNDC